MFGIIFNSHIIHHNKFYILEYINLGFYSLNTKSIKGKKRIINQNGFKFTQEIKI